MCIPEDNCVQLDLTNKQCQAEAKIRTDAEKLNREMDSEKSLNWEWKLMLRDVLVMNFYTPEYPGVNL